MIDSIARYKNELEQELQNILIFWMQETVDNAHGGFYGRIDNSNLIYNEAPKGSVLNSRILWSFSAAYNLTNCTGYLKIAERAFNYIRDHFYDKEFGGIYWSVDYRGNPLDSKKQFYALSFAVYALSEFYKSSANKEAKKLAIELYATILDHSHDKKYGGYMEALSRDWKDLDDLRLSSKDQNEKKSMNTHLHILEGFANLYCIWPDKGLSSKIQELINIFLDNIIDKNNYHLNLFFDERWNKRSGIISYGHDIEAAWLIHEAAEIIHNKKLIEAVKKISLKIADAASEGLDEDGGLWYEFNLSAIKLTTEKHWWPQAEAMIGFFNAWQISSDVHYLKKSLASWSFVRRYIVDQQNQEWIWGIKEDYRVMDEDKVGIWKCPYHNSRACIELIKRITKVEASNALSKHFLNH
ncbi:MAG: AGE family epimerase/isomerase [Ginsengibacter sp.]